MNAKATIEAPGTTPVAERRARRLPPSLPAVVLGVVLAIGGVAALLNLGPDLGVERLRAFVESMGALGPAIAILLMVLHSFVPVPAEILAIVNGMCFGLIGGTAVTWTGAMLGALLAFALARWLGRPFVERFVPAERLDKADLWVGDWPVLLGARLLPVVAFNLANYAAGLTRVGLFTFVWTTAIGILPATLLIVGMGDGMVDLHWVWSVVIAMACVALWAVARRVLLRAGR